MPPRSPCAAIRSCRSTSSAFSSRRRSSASCWAKTRELSCIIDGTHGIDGRRAMIADIKKTAEQKMRKTVEALKTDLAKVRTGRAHTGLLDHIMVDYYGTPTPIPQVGNVTLLDARTIAVSPWDKKMAPAIEKALRASDY